MKKIIVALCLLATLAAPTAAANAPNNDPFGFAANYRDDITSWAEKYGITFAEALARATAREAFNQTITAIETDPDTFTGAYFTQDASSYATAHRHQGRPHTHARPTSKRGD